MPARGRGGGVPEVGAGVVAEAIEKVLRPRDFGARRACARAGCAAFDAPEVRRGGAHDLRSALWTLGCVLHLLLTGAPYTPLEAEAQLPRPQRPPPRGAPAEGERAVYPERVEAMWSFVSAESRAVVASLLRCTGGGEALLHEVVANSMRTRLRTNSLRQTRPSVQHA